MSSVQLAAALLYADRGWAVFPCHEPIAGGCSCGRSPCSSPAKHPRTSRGLHDASTDPGTIRRWWHRWPTANVAVRTGSLSGLVVLDVDPAHGGVGSLANLLTAHGPLPRTATIRTGSGGHHYWFVHPGRAVCNSAGAVGAGLDIRGDGGYVIAPPSIHAAGDHYLWVSTRDPAPLPAWLLSSLHRERDRLAPPGRTPWRSDARPWASAAFEGELAHLRNAPEGMRNHTLNRSAFALGRLVAARHLDPEDVRDALIHAGLQIGLTPREVEATVASGLRAGRRFPRWPARERKTVRNAREPRATPEAGSPERPGR